MNIHTVFHIPTLHGKIFEGIFPMWKFAKLLPSKQTKSNLTFTIYCPNFGGNYIEMSLVATNLESTIKKNLESIRNVIFKNTADFKFLKDKTLFIPRMSFDGLKNNAMGLGITIHQVYATKIELIDYFCDLDKKYWQGIFRYTLFDHFGLDWNDVLLHGEDSMPSPNTGNHFKAWYLLQRYRKAKPFIVELKHEMYVNGKF